MATFSIVVTGARKIEAINQARKVYNDEQGASLTREQYLQMVIDSAVASWRARYSDEIDAVLAGPEVAALAVAEAAVRAKAGAKSAD